MKRTREPRTVTRMREPRTMMRMGEPRTVMRMREPRTVMRMREPRTVMRMREPRMVMRTGEPRTVMREPRTVTGMGEPRTVMRMREPRTVMRTGEPRTVKRTGAAQNRALQRTSLFRLLTLANAVLTRRRLPILQPDTSHRGLAIRATWRHRGHIPAGRVDGGISRQHVGHSKGGVVATVSQRASQAVHRDLSTNGMDYSRGGPEALLCLGPRRQRPALSGASAVSSVRAVCGVSTVKERTGKSVLRWRNITLQDSGIRAPHSLLYAKVGVTGILQQKTLTGHTPVDVTGILLQKKKN